jgi:prolyl 4-hydroxylase
LVPQHCQAFWSVGKPAAAVEEATKDDNEVPDYSVIKTPIVEAVDKPVSYGVDVSFPIHYNHVSDNYAWLPHNVDPQNHPTPDKYKDMPVQPLGDRQSFYNDFINGCVEHFGTKGRRCLETERDRYEMSLRQPQSMQNYTEIGYKKIRAPEGLWNLVKDFWDKNHHLAKEEQWGVGNTYTNNWKSPSKMVSVEDTSMRGGGRGLKNKIWEEAKKIIGEWTGQELTPCSLYGIRIYHKDAVLATHVDRLPLVSSAIINVAQDVDEPWPLEVYGHNGMAENVTMEPGDMVLYESHSVLHGRPYPLKGRYMANIFVHFEPTGHSLRHNAKIEDLGLGDVHEKYRDALSRGVSGHENDNTGLPPYLIPGTPEEPHWRLTHPAGSTPQKPKSFTTGSTPAHAAAQAGDVTTLVDEIKKQKNIVHAKDANGWTPLHEGARSGHLEVVKLLVENGADVNLRTYGKGGTVLWWAKQALDEDHPVVQFLESMGALEAGPEL